MESNIIDNPKELNAALERLGMDRHEFTKALNDAGINVTSQAVWKWLKGKTACVPGYIGYYLFKQHGISKGSFIKPDF